MCLPVLQRTARCTRTSVVVRAQQQQSKAEKPELAQVLLLPCVLCLLNVRRMAGAIIFIAGRVFLQVLLVALLL